ncbi:hypothetical protein BH09BAC1_BH09BAC1_20650 [soil metagenome]
MKTILTLAFAFMLAYNCYSQDTLSKVIEYDITMEAAGKMDVPLINYLVKKAGNKPWLTVLLDEIIAGEIAAYEVEDHERIDKEIIRKHVAGEVYDTTMVVDPITYEDTMHIARRDPWDVQKIVALRFTEEWTWNEDLKEMQLNYLGFIPLMDVYRDDDYLGKKPLFWVKLN